MNIGTNCSNDILYNLSLRVSINVEKVIIFDLFYTKIWMDMSKPKVYEALQSELGSAAQKKEKPVFRKLLWALSWTGIIVLLLTSLSSSMFEEFDKVLHFTAYMTLGILFTLSQKGRYIPISLLSILFLSGLIEGAQSFIGRSPEWEDFVVNAYGIGTGAALGGLAKAFIH